MQQPSPRFPAGQAPPRPPDPPEAPTAGPAAGSAVDPAGGESEHDAARTHTRRAPAPASAPTPPSPAAAELLDSVGEWPAVATHAGTFRLTPVRLPRDLRTITTWMNDPAVAAFWELAGPQDVTRAHLHPQLEGDGRSVPCLGLLDGVPMSYWEIYRADLDPLSRHCRTLPHDTGVHVLIGGSADRGRGLGTALLRAVADLVLDQRPRCTRVLAEPDLRNTGSIAAFLSAGYRFSAEIDLPGKRAALMVRDRALRTAD